MKREDISFLNQLVNSLEDAEAKLEKAHKEGDAEEFNKTKKFMLHLQNQISGALK